MLARDIPLHWNLLKEWVHYIPPHSICKCSSQCYSSWLITGNWLKREVMQPSKQKEPSLMGLVKRWFYIHTFNGCFIRCLQVVINSMWQFYYWTNNASDKQDTACEANVNRCKEEIALGVSIRLYQLIRANHKLLWEGKICVWVGVVLLERTIFHS